MLIGGEALLATPGFPRLWRSARRHRLLRARHRRDGRERADPVPGRAMSVTTAACDRGGGRRSAPAGVRHPPPARGRAGVARGGAVTFATGCTSTSSRSSSPSSTSTGQLMSRATVDLQSVRFFLGYGALVQSAITIVIAAPRGWSRLSGLALVALAPTPFVVWIAYRYGRRNRPASQEVSTHRGAHRGGRGEHCVRVLKAFAQEPRQLRRFRPALMWVFDQSMVSTRLRAFYAPFIGFLPLLRLAALLLVGGQQVIDGRITIGEFHRFLRLRADAGRSDAWPRHGARDGAAGAASGARVRAARPGSATGGGARCAAAPCGRRARGAARRDLRLRRRMPRAAGHRPRRGAGLDAVALVGPTGSGMTRGAMLIPRLYDVEHGSVLVDGVDVRDLTSRAAARGGGRGVG